MFAEIGTCCYAVFSFSHELPVLVGVFHNSHVFQHRVVILNHMNYERHTFNLQCKNQKIRVNETHKQGFHNELHPYKQVFHQVVVNFGLQFTSQVNKPSLKSDLSKKIYIKNTAS